MRTVRVYPAWRSLEPGAARGCDAIVIDTLRATTTIAVALANGARVLPVEEVTEAKRRARALGWRALLAGERKGLPIPGFDLGNSPVETARAASRIEGRILVLTTTNGTRAIARCRGARRVFAAALINARAVARAVSSAAPAGDIAVVCAGRGDGGMSIEDLATAGAVVAALRPRGDLRLTDGARAATDVFERHRLAMPRLLLASDSGRYLASIGAAKDLRACAALNRLDVVPLLRRGCFVDAG